MLPLLQIVNFVSVRLFSWALQRCRRSSRHWHKCDPRAAVTDGLSSVGKHLRFISTVWREIQDFGSLFWIFAHSPFLSDVSFFFLPWTICSRCFLECWSWVWDTGEGGDKQTKIINKWQHLESIVSRKRVTHVSHLNFPPFRFVSADVQVFTVTPVSGSSEEVAHNKEHLQRVRKMGFGLDRSDEWKLKVSLYADDTQLSSRWN